MQIQRRSEDLASKLKLPKKACSIPVGALNQLSTTTKHIVTSTIKSTKPSAENLYRYSLTLSLQIRNSIVLLQKTFHWVPAQHYHFCVGQHKISNPNLDLCLQKTRLGWVIGGYVNLPMAETSADCNFTNSQ